MLEVRGVFKHYGFIEALSDVSLTVGRREIVAIVGENGAGKSTLVRCIARDIAPDSGSISVDGVELGRRPRDAIECGVSVVWQDLALCGNLDVTANLFLGRELGQRGTLRSAAMESRAAAMFEGLGIRLPGLDRPIERLSGGQRQLVAIARATLDEPRVLVLDEPTASLGVGESQSVLEVVSTLRARGVATVLVSHQLDKVFDIADRIVVLRHGRVVADLLRAETHPDDVVALITGANVDSTAGQQLRRLHSLAEQLAGADESAVLPLTVSSLSGALSTDRLAIFMIEPGEPSPVLRCSATLHLSNALAGQLDTVPLETSNFLGEAACNERLVVVSTLATRVGDDVASAVSAHDLVGAWAAPIVGQSGTIAVIAGFHGSVSRLQPDQIRLLELFSTMAGAAIERGRLVESLRRRNVAVESMRGVLEMLAGPDLLTTGLSGALDELCRGVNSEVAALYLAGADGVWSARATSNGLEVGSDAEMRMRHAICSPSDEVDPILVAATFDTSSGRAALVCGWRDGHHPPGDTNRLVDDAANSFRLAMEREVTLEIAQEAAALQRSRELEREVVRRLGHEMRTPLTAIQGFASTMLQPDVSWPDADKDRFLRIIEREAGRMGRLVAQLFDDTAIEFGALRLDCNYCDLVAIVAQAATIAAPPESVVLDLPQGFTIWGDRDRLEQIFVNLIGNAARHNPDGTTVGVRLITSGRDMPRLVARDASFVTVEVSDDGAGLPHDALAYLNGETDDRAKDQGIGLRLVKGLTAAHGGSVRATAHSGTTVAVRLPIDRETS